MDLKLLGTVFATVFLAEMADKTQFATVLYASDAQNRMMVVFLGSVLALTLATAIAVFAGSLLGSWLDQKLMGRIAGVAFVLVGVWIFVKAGGGAS